MKYVLWTVFVLIGFAASAQGLPKIEKRVFKIGTSFVYAAPSSSIYSPGTPLKPALNLGFAADYRLGHSPFRFRIGAQYQPKGYLVKTPIDANKSLRTNYSLHYIDVPLDLTVTVGNRLTKLYVSAGAYVGVGVFGQQILKAKGIRFLSGSDTTSTLRYQAFGKQSYRFSRLDYGLNASIGIQRENVQFGLAYSHGLANLLNYNQAGVYTRSLGIFLNYRFDGF